MKAYDFAFGCGFSCGVTLALRKANLQFASLPFDWTATPGFLKAAQTVAGRFAHWLDREDLELVDVRHSGVNKRIYRNRRTGFGFVHDFSLFQTPEESFASESAKYARRIERFEAELGKAKRVLAVAAECPKFGRISDAELDEVRRTFAAARPGVEFELLYFYPEDGRAAPSVVSDRDGVTVVACEYRKYLPSGELHHEIDNAQFVDFLRANVTVPDPRTPAEKARYEAEWRRQDAARWHGRNWLETMVNRTAFRQYRRLEKFLSRKGLFPPERPLWFV